METNSLVPGIVLVLGGVRSGKSAFAESLVSQSGGPVIYLATGQAADKEMADRIRIHRERRPSGWRTVEEALEPAAALSSALSGNPGTAAVLIDSVDVWVANLLLAHEQADSPAVADLALAELEKLVATCVQASVRAVLVSSEVGLSPVSPNRLGRQFQDLLGTVNQRLAAMAGAVYLVVAGIPLQLKPQ